MNRNKTAARNVQEAKNDPPYAARIPLPPESLSRDFPYQVLDRMQATTGNRETGRWLESNPNGDVRTSRQYMATDRESDQRMRVAGSGSEGQRKPSEIHDRHTSRESPAPTPSGLGGFLASSQGQPLPDNLRASAEQEFGRSFSGVRTHSDAEAHGYARQAKARAFTYGEDLVFRAGQYTPETEGGRNLLWHELSHVASREGGGSEVYRAPLYDLSTRKIPPLPTGHTAKSMHALLDKMMVKTPPDITSANVKGVTAGSEAEIFLLHILFQVGKRDHWDSFFRLETAIGWAPAPAAGKGGGTSPPQGLVNVTIDDKGNATAELVHTGLAWHVTTGKTTADAITQIKNDFQVHSVAKGDKDWGEKGFENDAGDVLDSFQLLPTSNKPAIKGVDILRYATLPKDYAGEFNSGGGVGFGATSVTALPTLKLADSAFVGVIKGPPQTVFQSERVGGDYAHQTPASFQTILHESGHAVEAQAYRPAKEALDQAIIKQNLASASLKATSAKASAAAKAGDPTAGSLAGDAAAKRMVYDAAVAVVQKDKKALGKTRVSDKVVKPLSDAANGKKKALDSAVKAATAAAKAFNPQELTESADYRNAISATDAALGDYAKKSEGSDLDVSDDLLSAAFADLDTKRNALAAAATGNPAPTTFASVEVAQKDWKESLLTLAHTRGRTLRLQKFVDLVNAAGIVPFTAYARKNWPLKPQEFYAEAYSLWLTDPDFLKTPEYKPVFDFFDSGAYEK